MVKVKKNQFFLLLLTSTLLLSMFVIVSGKMVTFPSTIEGASLRSERNLTSGIQGKILRGPTSPVCRTGSTCYEPYHATVLVKDTFGNIVTKFASQKDGTFKVFLPGGTYILDPQEKGTKPFPQAGEQTVDVTSGYTEVIIIYDTGLR